MARRTSIELHPDGCRLVEVRWSGAARPPALPVRVRSLIVNTADGSDASTVTEALARLRRTLRLPRDAWVTVWGLHATQRLLHLPPESPANLEARARREAQTELARLEAGGGGVSVAIVAGDAIQVGSHRCREVSLVAASASDLRDQIQPVVEAGFIVCGAGTPGLALAALARSRGTAGTAAYVFIEANATCLAIVRGGVLLLSREMAWGHAADAPHAPLDGRLAMELKRSIQHFRETFRTTVESVVLCGDAPRLPGIAASLGDALGMPVEALDAFEGIDAAVQPEPVESFRAKVAALRSAIAAGADPAPLANLLPPLVRRAQEARLMRVRAIAAGAAGLLIAGGWYWMAAGDVAARRADVVALGRQVAALESEAARRGDYPRPAEAMATWRAAIRALDAQGPRLAGFLEVLSRAASADVVVTSITAEAEEAYWQITVNAVATADDPARARAAANAFLDAVSISPLAGSPVAPPSLRVVPAGGDPQFPGAPARTDVEISARFQVLRQG